MGAFKLKIINDPSHQAEFVDQFVDGTKEILEQLRTQISPLAKENDPTLSFLNDILDKDKIHPIFTNNYADIQKHPELWAKTTRIGASKILVDDASGTPSTYQELNKQLIDCLKHYSRFKNPDRQIRKKINKALDKLQQWQDDVTSEYIKRLSELTAKRLKEKLDGLAAKVDSEKLDALKRRLDEIIKLDIDNLRTSSACLTYTKKSE